MRIAHIALWTNDLSKAAEFWKTYFEAAVGEEYHSKRREGFVSRFVSLPSSDVQIELMRGPWVQSRTNADVIGWDHIAISLGSKVAVDALSERCEADGCLVAKPRMTGDGYYEAIISMPDGTPIEITS